MWYKELLIKEIIRSLWEQIISFKRSSYSKRDAIEENHCLIQQSPFDVHNFFSVLATPLHVFRVSDQIIPKLDCLAT